MRLDLHRDPDNDSYGTFGFLEGLNRIYRSCEPPWLEWGDKGATHFPYGVPYKSCVPVGEYRLVWRESEKYGPSWFLVGEGVHVGRSDDVGRFACLFHSANWPWQLQGCVSLGLRQAMVAGFDGVPRWGIRSSGVAIKALNSQLDTGQIHHLVIH